ncbi:MAG TPA: iron-sulfur cluster-binding domain-containing protein [Marmoricola sp.]
MGVTQKVLGSKVVAALTSPHPVDRYLEVFNPMWAATEVRARVLDVRRENPASDGAPVATLTLQPTSTWRGHRAGQYVQVGVELPGSSKRLTRCFSISSAASAPGERFTLTIRAQDDTPAGRQSVSTFLVREARPGQVLHLGQAEGSFTLTESPATPTNNRLLMISGGSGITPVMSQLRTLLRDTPRYGNSPGTSAGRRVTFLHYARSPQDQIFADELAAIAAADNNVDVHLRHGDQVFSEFELRRLVPRFREVDTWACGPAPMMELVAAAYGVTPTDTAGSRLRTEFFKPPTLAGAAAEGEVAFTRSGASGANTGASLLEQAEALGLKPDYGCRMGICFSCTSRKTSGTVRNVLTGETSSLPDEDIRICVSAPEGDCSVEL